MSSDVDVRSPELSHAGSVILKFASIAALIILLFGRALGPSDLWDHTQTRTVSYTTDIIIHGGTHWILPIERGEVPASKPPLYNWIAVPLVKWLGFNSEFAHRFPSIAALCVCWLVIVRLGNSIDPRRARPALGWLAGLAFAANYEMFKLGYLARPDMLLTLWLFLGWIAATHLLIHAPTTVRRERFLPLAVFWGCVVLAAFTKGPAALVLPVYFVVAARVLCGSWRSISALSFAGGMAAALGIFAWWLYMVWRISPDHAFNKLLNEEFVGRVAGTGPEGNRNGSMGLLIDFPVHAIYFVQRFLPWSIPALASMWLMIRSRDRRRRNQWVIASTAFVLVVVGLYSLSAGKRADYIAGAMPQCAILAAWCLLNVWSGIGVRWPWIAPAAGITCLAAFIVQDQAEFDTPLPGFGEGICQFINQSSDRIVAEPQPGGVIFCWTGETQLQALLGSSQVDGKEAVFAAIDRGEPFWLLAGRKTSEPNEFAQWLRPRRPTVQVDPVIASPKLVREQGWPEQVTLYRVTP